MPVVAATLSETRLGRFNPAAKLAAAAVVMVGLLVTVDVVTASVVLGAELVVVPVAGVPWRTLAVRAWPLPLGAAGVAVANLIASNATPGTVAGVSLRLMAIALPGILLFASTDAVDLADSLVQQLHVPARFAYGALAALRLFTSAVYALLVAAIRRGTRLAMAMDSRGFDSRSPRTAARQQHVRPSDRVLVASVAALVLAANLLAVAVGVWHPLLG